MSALPFSSSFILTVSCPDKPGLVHRVSGFLFESGANITEAAQHNDPSTGLFFMRVQFEKLSLTAAEHQNQLEIYRANFAPLAQELGINWGIFDARAKLPTVLMVSKHGHCLNDLLFRMRSGTLPIDVRAVVSNHRDFYQLCASYNVPFHYVPVDAQSKAKGEERLLDIFQTEKAELLVLARYMQILSPNLCDQLSGRAINIHHSALPSFKGARPHEQAFNRGVKLIGATAHYVTTDLDEGPIIEQDTARVNHAMSIAQLTNLGRDIESTVLARAVHWHAEHRVLLNGRKTVVFS